MDIEDSNSPMQGSLMEFHAENTLTTGEAKAIARVLANVPPELRKFDRIKSSIKFDPLVSNNDLLENRAPLETLTLKTLSLLKEEY